MHFYFIVFGLICFLSGWQFAELKAKDGLNNYFLDFDDLEDIFQESLDVPREGGASFAYFDREWLEAWEGIEPDLLENFLDTKIMEGTGFKSGGTYFFPTAKDA